MMDMMDERRETAVVEENESVARSRRQFMDAGRVLADIACAVLLSRRAADEEGAPPHRGRR